MKCSVSTRCKRRSSDPTHHLTLSRRPSERSTAGGVGLEEGVEGQTWDRDSGEVKATGASTGSQFVPLIAGFDAHTSYVAQLLDFFSFRFSVFVCFTRLHSLCHHMLISATSVQYTHTHVHTHTHRRCVYVTSCSWFIFSVYLFDLFFFLSFLFCCWNKKTSWHGIDKVLSHLFSFVLFCWPSRPSRLKIHKSAHRSWKKDEWLHWICGISTRTVGATAFILHCKHLSDITEAETGPSTRGCFVCLVHTHEDARSCQWFQFNSLIYRWQRRARKHSREDDVCQQANVDGVNARSKMFNKNTFVRVFEESFFCVGHLWSCQLLTVWKQKSVI